MQPVLIDGRWRQAASPTTSFTATNPTTRQPLEKEYPVSSFADLERALAVAQRTVAELRAVAPDRIAAFLEAMAGQIEARAEELAAMAHAETGLPAEPRLRSVELPRTTNQLRQAAAAARDRSWCRATIDSRLNIRSRYAPLGGPVIIFGPNNFPFAFNGMAGGDFAAAIAAGNPVIVKANPGHPGTTTILAEAAHAAVNETGLPAGLVQLFYHCALEDGLRLVAHPLTGATAFTGSRAGGLRLKEAADRAGKPIYLEMSSVNPVFVLPGALAERLPEIADELFASCTLGAGQFCTNPGLVILLDDGQGHAFQEAVTQRLQQAGPGTLLSERGPDHLAASLAAWQAHGAELVTGGAPVAGAGYAFENSLLRVPAATFLQHAVPLQSEAFGAASLLVFARDAAEMMAVAGQLEGNLTGSIYSHRGGLDDALYAQLEPLLRPRVGRLLNDKMPTGVAVTPAMNHGGPYPSTGHPGFTAVGIPAALLRFAALHCYDNVRHERLPAELQDKNPTGRMWRLVDEQWSQAGA